MSRKFVKRIERRFYNNARKCYVIPDWKSVFLISAFKRSSSQLFLFFFKNCSEQFLTCQDQTGSYIIHGLVKSQLSTSAKRKILETVIDRGINCVNLLDGIKRSALDYLIDNNDIKCIEVLLKHGHYLQVSDKCLSRTLQLRNTQKICEVAFTYADKHYIASHLTKAYYYMHCIKSEKDDMNENDNSYPFYIKMKDILKKTKLKDRNNIKNFKSLPNISGSPIKLPNHEEIDMPSITDQEDLKSSIQKSEEKLTQESLAKTAKTKKHLKGKEAVAYMHSMKQKKSKILQFQIHKLSASNDSCCNNDLSAYKVLGLGSYSIVYEALCNGQPCVAKARNPCVTKVNNEQILQEIEILKCLNHPNVVQFLGIYYHGNTPLLVMEKMWLNLSKWLKINPSSSLKNKLCILIDVVDGLKYLHSQNMIHCDLIANNILLTTNLQAKIGDFGMAKVTGQKIIQVPSDFSHIPPEACTPDSVCTEKFDIFSFGCVMIHTITQEFPTVNKKSCVKDTEVKRRSKYLNKIKSTSPTYIYSIILHCLQDSPSCRPSTNKLHSLLKACVVLKSHYYSDELLKHKEIGQGSYSKPYVSKNNYPFIAVKISVKVVSLKIPNLTSLDHTHIIHFWDVHHNRTMTMENWWMNLSMELRNYNSKVVTEKIRIIAEFVEGLKYLHLKKICNYGLAADHVLLSIKLQTKIYNFDKNSSFVTDPAIMSSSTCTCSLKKSAENFLCNLVNVQSVLQGFHELDTTEFCSRVIGINNWFECISMHLQAEPISRLSAYYLYILCLFLSNKSPVQQQHLIQFHHCKSLNDTSPIMIFNYLTFWCCRFPYKYYQDKNSCTSQEVSIALNKQPSLKRNFFDLLLINLKVKLHKEKFTLQCITITIDFSKTEIEQFFSNFNAEDIQLILKIKAYDETSNISDDFYTRKQKIVPSLRYTENTLLWISCNVETINSKNIRVFSDFNGTNKVNNCIKIINILWKNVLSYTYVLMCLGNTLKYINTDQYTKATKILQLIHLSFHHKEYFDIARVFISQNALTLNKIYFMYYGKKVGVIKIAREVLLCNTQKEVCEIFFKHTDKDKIAHHLTNTHYSKSIKNQYTKSEKDDMKENNHITLKDDSPNISSGLIKLPNHEETDRLFEISINDQEELTSSIQKFGEILTQESLAETKTKKHLNTKEAVAYLHSKKLQFYIHNTSVSSDSCCKDDLSGYKVLGLGSYSIVYEALCNGQPCVAKTRNRCNAKANDEQILQEIEILLTTKLQAKIGDFGMAKVTEQKMIQVPSDFSHMPPEVCTPDSIYTEKLDIFSFGCIMIHTITQEFPTINKKSCVKDTEIKRRSKYLNKIKSSSPICSIILHCVQDNSSCQPCANKLPCVVLKSHYYSDELLKHKEISQGSYSKPYVSKNNYPFIAVKISVKVVSLEIPNLTSLDHTHIIHFWDVHHNRTMTMENWWMNLSMELRNYNSKVLTEKIHIILEFVIKGLKYLHLKKICNYGLTADHVLLSIKLQTNLDRNDKNSSFVTDPAIILSSTCTCSLKKSAENFLCNLVNVQSVLQGFHELDTTEFFSTVIECFECISMHLQTEPISRLSTYRFYSLCIFLSHKPSVQQQDLIQFHHRTLLNDALPSYWRFMYKYYQIKNICSSQEVTLVNYALNTCLSLCKRPSLKRKFLGLLLITLKIKLHQGKLMLQCITITLDFDKTEKSIVLSLDTDESPFFNNVNAEDIQLIFSHNETSNIPDNFDTRKQKIVPSLRYIEITLLSIAWKRSDVKTINSRVFCDFNGTLQILYLEDTLLNNSIKIINLLWKNVLIYTYVLICLKIRNTLKYINIDKYIKAAKLIDLLFNHNQFHFDIGSVFVLQNPSILNKLYFMCYYLDNKKVGVLKILKKIKEIQLLIEGKVIGFLKEKNENILHNLQTASVFGIWCTDVKNISTDVLTKCCFIDLINAGTDLMLISYYGVQAAFCQVKLQEVRLTKTNLPLMLFYPSSNDVSKNKLWDSTKSVILFADDLDISFKKASGVMTHLIENMTEPYQCNNAIIPLSLLNNVKIADLLAFSNIEVKVVCLSMKESAEHPNVPTSYLYCFSPKLNQTTVEEFDLQALTTYNDLLDTIHYHKKQLPDYLFQNVYAQYRFIDFKNSNGWIPPLPDKFISRNCYFDSDNVPDVYVAKDKISTPCQAVNSSFQHNKDILYVSTTQRSHLPVFEEINSEASGDTCVNEYYESLDFIVSGCFAESESFESLHRCTSSSNTLFLSTSLVECISTNGQESFQHVGEPAESSSLTVIGQTICSPFYTIPTIPCTKLSDNVSKDGILSEIGKSRTREFDGGHDEDSFVESDSCDSFFCSTITSFLSNGFPESSTHGQESQHVGEPSESSSLNVIGQRLYSPFHAVATISCSNLSVNVTILQDGVLAEQQRNRTRGYGDGSSDSSSDEDNNGEDKRGIHTSLVSHYHSHNPQQNSLPHSPRYHSLSAAVNKSITPQTAAGTGLVGSKHDGRLREIATAKPFVGMGVTLPKSPATYTSKGEYLISDSLNERGPILLDIPDGRNELVMAAYSTQSIPKLYPIIGFRKELPGIALPPPIPLDLPKLRPSKEVTNIASHQQMNREQPVKSGFDIRTVPEKVPVQQPQYMASVASHQQQAPLSQSLDFSDPVIIIDRAALFLTAGDYGATIKVLEILDKHLVLPDDIDMAKEFGQGLANYKNLHYKAAKTCFTALFEKSINYHSSGNQALASIYLGEIEMSWAKYKDAEKHFTIAVTNYSPDNVAEKYQQIILTKSAVLVKKGQCHRSLSQIKEAINAFKIAKEVAESAQQQARGTKLKTAKEDELSAVCALGNIMQSIGDYDQSFEYYEKSLKLAVELGDQVSIGWAHGNLGNAMLGLDQKDRALDHLITAFHMSARYEGNPLAVGRAVSNLGNAYQAMNNLKKAKEHYEIALGHAIYGNDLQGQGRACGNIGNIYMLMKEPVQAVHYYTETLRLSTDRSTKITGYHNRGCARFDVAECIIQGKKPKELVPTTTQDSEYGRLAIKLTDEVITTDPVQETKPNRDPSAQSISEQKESSMSVEMLPVVIKGKVYEGVANVEIVRMAEALPFLETAQRDLLEAIESHEQGVQNVKGSHEALSLSLSLFESNSRSFYKMQETLIELGKLCQRLSKLGLIDMTATEPQEFKNALVYGEQARARTLGELILQKKKTMYSDLFSISTPLTIQDIYKAVKLQKYPVIFLSYCVSKLLMWILVPVKDEVIMRCQSVELKEEDLENSSFELYIRYNLLQFLSKDEIYIFRSCAYEQESPFTVLHDVIGVKIIEGLKSVGCSEVTEFIVIPDSVTHLLPFSPLMNKHNWQFFGDKYRIRIVPSFLSLLVMSVTSNPVVEIPGDKSDFLIVGNPTIPQFMYDSTPWSLGRLPYAEKEAISVASVLGTIPVLREQATKQSVLYRLRSAKVIHLATHGSASAGFLAFTSSFPVSKSGLAEKEHILIFPKEIETLNISPALVVLSSCDSARGAVKAEGVIGMARAFLSAGAHSVLVSLWRVPDESAHVFMNFFYQFLVNGLPSLQALQRSMQCLRCFLKYSHYVHWSGFQIIGKEVTFLKDSNAQFPIQNMLGEVSIFPRQQVKNMEENLLGIKNKIFSDVQILVGTPGNEPEECARDFIKNCYYYYPCGVYWYDASNELLLETTMKVAHQTPLMGGVYKEQKDLDPLPTISNPSLLSTKSSKPMSRKEKKLIVLNNFSSLETCACIMREMRDASTDIIVVSNELFCKEEIAKEFDKNFNRGCNIIEVTNLQPISITQRIVYGLLEKNSFVAKDADHIVFTLLSEFSRGAATIVHMLASMMQKSDDNSRTGFELAKQHLKLHIAHQKLRKDLDKYSMQNTLSEAKSIANTSEKAQERGGDIVTEMKPEIDHASADPDYSSLSAPRGLGHCDEMLDVKPSYSNDNKKQSGISDATSGFVSMGTKTDEVSKSPIIIEPEGYSVTKHSCEANSKKQGYISDATSNLVNAGSKNDDTYELPIAITSESYIIPEVKTASSSSEGSSIYIEAKSSEVEGSMTLISQPTGDRQSVASGFMKTITNLVTGSDDDKQTSSSDTTQPPATAKPGKESLDSVKQHPLYLFINDLLSTTCNISLPAHHLLNSLVITGPIPLPLFYVEELDNIILSAVYNKEKERIQPESPLKQLIKEGVIRKSCYPILYHKDLNSDYIDHSIQLMFVPKLICDAVKDEMDDTDKALSVLSIQCALENLLMNETKSSPIHLQYLLILCNQLHDVCSEELQEFGDQLLIINQKLKLRVALMGSELKG